MANLAVGLVHEQCFCEGSEGYPDITFIVHRKDQQNPYPSQINFQPAKPTPNSGQLLSLRKGTDEIIDLYCPPNTANPYWPEPHKAAPARHQVEPDRFVSETPAAESS
jgi:hypothetical protein